MNFFRNFGCKHAVPFLTTALFLAAAGTACAQIDVITWHNDNIRSGLTTDEAILTPQNVNSTTFGLLANVTVDGKVDAQPLYVSAVPVAGLGLHNVLYVATEHDSLYALDADSGALLWQKSMLGTGETTSDARNCGQVVPEIGITATPVIDTKAGPHGVLYLVAMSKNATSGTYIHRIHAIDLSSGAELFNGPVVVNATYPGTGDASKNGVVTFNPSQLKDRPGLLLFNGSVYTSWGSHCDVRPYSGWLIAYNEYTLAQTAVLDLAPNGNDAALWNSGAAPAVDEQGYIYVATANGTFDQTLTGQGMPSLGDYGNSVVKIARSGNTLVPTDYWTMYNTASESSEDADLGSGGLMVLPDQVDNSGKTRHLAVVAGKDSNIYVVDRDNLGHFDSAGNATVYQYLAKAVPGGIWASPAYFNSHVYLGSVGAGFAGDHLRSFSLNAALLENSPVQETPTTFGYPGVTPSISAYNVSDAIVWAPENSTPAVLHAYNATNLSDELYNSNQAANGRDQFGAGNKFIVPTIANGKVYVGTQNSVGIFGLRRLTPPVLQDGVYTLTNAGSMLLLDSPSAAAYAGMNQLQADSQQDQQWFFSYNGNGDFTIQNVVHRHFLADAGSTTASTAQLVQAPPSHDSSQLWSLTASGSGYLIQNKKTGRALTVTTATPGTGVTLQSASTGIGQTWLIQ
jgi:hypothetical protein